MATITQLNSIKSIITLANGALATATHSLAKYEIAYDAYEQVRTLQEEATPTDHTETPCAALVEYLDETLVLVDAALATANASIAAAVVVPDPLPDGLILEASGSGSGL